ncbi:hypothetical protein CW304_20200 [Bacillus sp. UFRGS-B20]|nr:hypothetical protein CW304_20200 [Bacillus sp. UFRGS-B20]
MFGSKNEIVLRFIVCSPPCGCITRFFKNKICPAFSSNPRRITYNLTPQTKQMKTLPLYGEQN